MSSIQPTARHRQDRPGARRVHTSDVTTSVHDPDAIPVLRAANRRRVARTFATDAAIGGLVAALGFAVLMLVLVIGGA